MASNHDEELYESDRTGSHQEPGRHSSEGVCEGDRERVGRGGGGAEIESSVYGDVEKKIIAS